MLNGVIIKPIKRLSDERGFLSEVLRIDWKGLLEEEYLQVVRMPGHYQHGLKTVEYEPAVLLSFTNKLYNYDRLYKERRLWSGQTRCKFANCKKDDRRSRKSGERNSNS